MCSRWYRWTSWPIPPGQLGAPGPGDAVVPRSLAEAQVPTSGLNQRLPRCLPAWVGCPPRARHHVRGCSCQGRARRVPDEQALRGTQPCPGLLPGAALHRQPLRETVWRRGSIRQPAAPSISCPPAICPSLPCPPAASSALLYFCCPPASQPASQWVFPDTFLPSGPAIRRPLVMSHVLSTSRQLAVSSMCPPCPWP